MVESLLYVPVAEAARRLGVSRQWVHHLIGVGRLVALRAAGTWLVRVDSLDAYREYRRVKGAKG